MAIAERAKFIRWFDEISIGDVPEVGGKNASLGEMYRNLSGRGIRVPNGFAITADAFREFLREAGLESRIQEALSDLDTQNVAELKSRAGAIRKAIYESRLPEAVRAEVVSAYERLSVDEGKDCDVAVRSSATAEDLPDASFAGQQETYLNVQGVSALLETVRRCFASLYTDRAVSYRSDKGFSGTAVALSVCVQRMVRSDVGASGVMFSIDTETGFRDVVLINAAWGLGENVVQGAVNPDEFYVFKPTLREGFRPIIQKTVGGKEMKMVYDHGGGKMVKNIPTSPEERASFAINDEDILQLARWAIEIEDYYSEKRGHPTPMDIEWARDGRTGALFIVQARPETVQSLRDSGAMEIYRLKEKGDVLVTGRSVGERIGSGRVRKIADVGLLHEFEAGDILVADKTDPDWEPIMKKAAAIVTNRGGRTCHAAIVSRELGIPAIVGTNDATEKLHSGESVTVSCAEGDAGRVYRGELAYDVERIALDDARRPSVKVMMNIASPEEALALSMIPNDGVGLARMEFIINNHIKIHPKALLKREDVSDPTALRKIDELTAGYSNKSEYFIDRLSQGIAMLAAAFHPKDVILRMSDFKSNEYANLIGGASFEPKEENPMIGFRGASRYYDSRYSDCFGLECEAVRRVRETMGLTNLKIMIPFCRTPEEGKKTLKEMEANGLVRGANGLEVYVMCEIPSNVILAERFAEIFDGFSIGSNDLTQLVLGVDRDSEIVAHIFNERDEAVKRMISSVIQTVKSKGRKIGICGQAPSDYPDFARFLAKEGIDSISLTPDTVARTTLDLLEFESKEKGDR